MPDENKLQTAAFYTLGCKVNAFDTEALMEIFKKDGYEIAPFDAFADVYVVNTCSVTHVSDKKSRNMLRRAKKINPNALVIATGCYAQVAPDVLLKIPEVDMVLGTQHRLDILKHIEAFRLTHQNNFVSNNFQNREYEELSVSDNNEHTRAYIKIQEGCDQFCSYCIVPYARGRVRSRSLEAIEREAERLAVKGFKEIVITGIHVSSYGTELSDEIDLLTVIQKVAVTPGIERVRLSSLEPRFLSPQILDSLKEIPEFCPHFHLSLQSGSDSVLKRMNRKYTTLEYAKVVSDIRQRFERPAITTDVMVGFPGETDEEFQQTLDFVRQINFYQMHVFKYSRRIGTVAADMDGQVDEHIKNQRSMILIQASDKMEDNFLSNNGGIVAPVLFETSVGNGYITGHTPNYIPVKIEESENFCGKIVPVALIYNGRAVMDGEIYKSF